MESAVKQRLVEFLQFEKIGQNSFEKRVGWSNGYISNIKSSIGSDKLALISNEYPLLNLEWLLTGSGDMLKSTDTANQDVVANKNLIPLYDNVSTIGGNLSRVADVDTAHSQPTEYIDTGDWFREATAAIRHYEDSMDEYPTGCILAIREIKDRSLIIPGMDYVVETDEYRFTKRIQLGKDDDHFTAYSTNKETYPDGRLIHEPFPIEKQAIRRIWLVLGHVVKKNSGTMVYNNR